MTGPSLHRLVPVLVAVGLGVGDRPASGTPPGAPPPPPENWQRELSPDQLQRAIARLSGQGQGRQALPRLPDGFHQGAAEVYRRAPHETGLGMEAVLGIEAVLDALRGPGR